MPYQTVSSFLKKSTHLNYDPKEHSMDAYIIARKTKSPAEALQATKIFALSNFFIFTENLSHNDELDANQVRDMLKRKILEFAGVLDLTEEQCEQSRDMKMKYSFRPDPHSASKKLEQVLNILLN